ncbi:hypothetical protein [Bacteroides uniformis]|jgi:hypothetical protein|nr:hypothetical protein [Bacteroides uniformis]
MFSTIVTLLLTASLVAIPTVCYKNESKFALKFWLRMTRTRWSKNLLTYILAAFIIGFHLAYYQGHRAELGIYISSILVFVSLASAKMVLFLKAIRHSKYLLVGLSAATLIITFIPGFLSLACSLAFIIEAACFYPGKNALDDACITDPKGFVNAYFA